MKYGDFSSLVQLGVGIHIGTAFLQLYGEIGIQPLVRTIARTRSLFALSEEERPSKAIEDELDQLESKYDIFKIRLFNAYKKYVIFNSTVAFVLAIGLATIAFKAEDQITDAWEWVTVLIVFLSIFPAPITLAILWFAAGQQVKPMKMEADALEKKALADN